jgi:hypothetical protein
MIFLLLWLPVMLKGVLDAAQCFAPSPHDLFRIALVKLAVPNLQRNRTVIV